MNPVVKKIPIVSVCIPVYNCEKYIDEAINSVLQQTYTNYELIIVDNCSTDATSEIAKKYVKQDSRVAYYRNEHNLGMAKNWNRAVLLARGKYIKLLCADDVIEPGYLQVFVDVLDAHPKVSLVTSFEQLIGDSHRIRKVPQLLATGELNGKRIQKHLLKFGNWVGSPSAVMFRRRDLYMGLFNPDWGWALDGDMWIRLLAVGNLYVVPRILHHSRVHNQQATAIDDKNFAFIKEELMFIKLAFQFPRIYGNYTKPEQEAEYYRLLNRLIRQGFAKKSLLKMTRIGMGYGRIRFCKCCIKSLFHKIIHNKITHKIKQLL